jgi:alpha-acetolactate decarboxylase
MTDYNDDFDDDYVEELEIDSSEILDYSISETLADLNVEEKAAFWRSFYQQAVFDGEDTTGTLIGYYAPDLYQGIASNGFHLHYLSADHALGGHVLDLQLAEADLNLTPFSDFDLHLPTSNADFLQANFDLTSLNDQIQQDKH